MRDATLEHLQLGNFGRTVPDDDLGEARIDARPSDIIAPRWQELAILAVINLLYVGSLSEGGSFMETMNLVGPTIVMLVMLYGCYSSIRRGVVAIWTPLFWVRLALAAYCGAGSLVPYFVNGDTRDMLDTFYHAFPIDTARYNLVNGVFAFSILAAAAVFANILEGKRDKRSGTFFGWEPAAAGPGLRVMALIFLAVGSIADYGFLVPYNFGLTTTILPQWVTQVAAASWIGCFLLVYSSLRDRSPLLYLAIGASVLSSFIGMLEFAKLTTIFPLMMMAMGFIYAKPKLLTLGIAGASIGVFYLVVTPAITYARNETYLTYGIAAGASFSERLNILASYTPERAAAQSDRDIQGGWARLSYINSGTFAINEYDLGRPGNTLANVIFILEPRFMFPNKPILSDIGKDFNIAVTGNPDSQSSPGMGAELYWNGGWITLASGSFILGMIFSILSAYSITAMRNDAYHLLFVVLIGMRMGTRIDGFLITDFAGPLVFAVLGHVGLSLLNSLTLKK